MHSSFLARVARLGVVAVGVAGFSFVTGCRSDALDPIAVFKDTLDVPSNLMLWPGFWTSTDYTTTTVDPGTIAVLSPGETTLASATPYSWRLSDSGFRAEWWISTEGLSPGVTWSSSDPDVASIDAHGKITAHRAGTTTIRAAAGKNHNVTTSGIVAVLSEPLRFSTLDVGNAGCGITGGHAVYCWGVQPRNSGANPDVSAFNAGVMPAPMPEPIQSVSVGGNYSAGHVLAACALGQSGAAYCWGVAKYSTPFGSSADATQLVPEPVPGGLHFRAIAVGASATCALDLDGNAYCWGYRLGDQGNVGPFSAPVAVSGGLHFKSIAVGKQACGIVDDGTAFCWGDAPTAVPGNQKFVQLAVADGYTCGLSAEHDVYCWGKSTAGGLGLGPGITTASQPTLVAGGVKFGSISAGKANDGALTCGLTVDAKAYCWGNNESGQLGAGMSRTAVSTAYTPTLVQAPGPFTSVSAGASHACGIANGKTYCWGPVFGHRTATPEVPTLMEAQGR